jgi:hypothetical protein
LERSISTVPTVSSTGLLKLSVDPQTLKLRSEGSAEIIYHVLFCYFSRRTGLIVQIEDSHLTRIQPHAGGDAVYWKTTISSALEDYRALEGIMIAHSGRRGSRPRPRPPPPQHQCRRCQLRWPWREDRVESGSVRKELDAF